MTDGSVRRAEIAALLEKADSPLSAAHLASQLGVSRQVIVGDIAPVSYTHLTLPTNSRV